MTADTKKYVCTNTELRMYMCEQNIYNGCFMMQPKLSDLKLINSVPRYNNVFVRVVFVGHVLCLKFCSGATRLI